MNAMHKEWRDIQASTAHWPTWANYLAMDADGLWNYHQKEPFIANYVWLSMGKAQVSPPQPVNSDWKSLIIKRMA